jgi:hypothetical protein
MGRLYSYFYISTKLWPPCGNIGKRKSPESKSITPPKKKRKCYLWLESALGQPAPLFLLAMVKTKNLQSFLLRLFSILTSEYNIYSIILTR